MLEVEPDVFKSVIARAAWDDAVAKFDGRDLRPSMPLEDAGWRAAGMLDEDGYLQDAWLTALLVAKNPDLTAFVIARRGELAYTTQLASNGRHVVVTTGRARVQGDEITLHEPIYEIFCAPVERGWQLVRRALPPEFQVSEDESHVEPRRLQLGAAPEQLAYDTDQSMTQFVDALQSDPVMQLARQAEVSVNVAIWQGESAKSWMWFTADGAYFRADEEALYRVGRNDASQVLASRLA